MPSITATQVSNKGSEVLYFDFLDSDIVTLRTPDSTHSFRIHKGLLGCKCRPISSALDNGFLEGQNGVYTCHETSDETLSRFIEWAYRGDYSDSPAQEKPSTKDILPEDELNTQLSNLDHPSLAHMEVYIFSDIYNVPDLKQLSFSKLTTCFVDIEKPDDTNAQLALIAVLYIAYTRLPPSDDLLDWLAQYAAYCVEKLSSQTTFHELLEDIPTLASRMMASLNLATGPPWAKGSKYASNCALDTPYNEGYSYYF